MIEIALGLLVVAAAVAAALGLAQDVLPTAISLTAAPLAGILGLLILAHGLFKLRLKKAPAARHWTRTSGLMWTTLLWTVLLVVVVPLFAPFLNLFRIAGFPLGFYMAAQGTLILIVVLLFAAAARADAIDEQEEVRED